MPSEYVDWTPVALLPLVQLAQLWHLPSLEALVIVGPEQGTKRPLVYILLLGVKARV